MIGLGIGALIGLKLLLWEMEIIRAPFRWKNLAF